MEFQSGVHFMILTSKNWVVSAVRVIFHYEMICTALFACHNYGQSTPILLTFYSLMLINLRVSIAFRLSCFVTDFFLSIQI